MDPNVNFSEVRIILILCRRVVVTFSVWCSKDFIPFQLHLMLHTQTVYRPVSRYPKLINFECFVSFLVNSAFYLLPNSSLTFIKWTLFKFLRASNCFVGMKIKESFTIHNKYCKTQLMEWDTIGVVGHLYVMYSRPVTVSSLCSDQQLNVHRSNLFVTSLWRQISLPSLNG